MKNAYIVAFLTATMVTGAVTANAFTGPGASGETSVTKTHFDGRGGPRPPHGPGPRGSGPRGMMMQMMRQADTDADGKLTQDELNAFVTSKVELGDANADGQIDLEEFKVIYLDLMSRQIVDRFQALDENGDGVIDAAEVDEKFGGVVSRMDRNGDGALSRDDAPRKMKHGGRRFGSHERGEHRRRFEHEGSDERGMHGRRWDHRDDHAAYRGTRPEWHHGPRDDRPMTQPPLMDDAPEDDAPEASTAD
ncbi:EF-hand domain-containing protein [Acuticoccus yangtzensis]|uniref:EF-hand domain-containing protein n=1 Tax=Acuticoccus yangtzensis TaxID=1443441 RepID=UPI0009497EF8|nr:EF-hand domain-containing protein [Acuticoccus yangtzensis]